MPLSDPARIRAQTPRIVDLWRALRPLQSCVSFMNTGAHPDDETSAMLAALAWRDGLDLSVACATRGEGGQNDIGTENGAALGALRTAEMERAADILPLRLYWLSESPEDPITDFGFSKSGVETLARWGRARTLARFVHIARRERPDILCPTFLDIPGQHGHHRAMTEAAHLVMDLAADPAFDGSDLPVWQVKKLYLPAWSGAGQAYDDALPPPPATLTVQARGTDPVTGWSYEQIGQQSRAFHATQGMGRWIAPGDERDWPLHLADSRVPGPDTRLTAGLLRDLSQLAAFADAPDLAPSLGGAQAAMNACIEAFPAFDHVLSHACTALRHLRAARDACPRTAQGEVLHRLARKEDQLARVIRLAAGVTVDGRLSQDWLHPGETADLTVETRVAQADRIEVDALLPAGWTMDGARITAGPDAAPHAPYRDTYLPDRPAAPALRVVTRVQGIESETHLPFEVPPVLLPERVAAVQPMKTVLNTATAERHLMLTLGPMHPEGALPELELPEGWHAMRQGGTIELLAPQDLAPGLYCLPLTLDGAPAQSLRRIAHPHVAPTALAEPACVTVRAVHAALPQARIAYVGGGHDRADHWLRQLGLEVETPEPSTLDKTALARIDTLVIGIFALRFRPGLAALMPRLRDWVARGGTLVTLYHRPWDGWEAATTPPRPIEIGQPSLRWRVTDENATVTHLVADHPVLTAPNRIGPDDWAGWHKERGLYFARAWDDAYRPLLEIADPDEAPHRGALLCGDIGRGRHIHCALILHHQMERLTPGAFRLMANMVTPRG